MDILKTNILRTLLLVINIGLAAINSNAQAKYFTKSGTITFESSVPSFEEIKATNDKVSAVLKDDGNFASLALIKGFRFKIALMEEHFNENYIESKKYPKATFSGRIKDFSMDKLSAEFREFDLDGKLTMRAIGKDISTKCKLKYDGKIITLTTEFSTKPENFGIEIPNIVRKKIAETVTISAKFELKKR